MYETVLTVAKGPTIYNVTMTTADTEYSQELLTDTRKFLIKCRGTYDIKVAFVSGTSGTTYITVPSGQTYYEDHTLLSDITLYFQCATAAQVVEVVVWV